MELTQQVQQQLLVSLPMQDLQALSERSADAQGLSGPTRRRGVGS